MKHKFITFIAVVITPLFLWQEVGWVCPDGIYSLRPAAYVDRASTAWKEEDWDAIANILGLPANGRVKTLEAVVDRSQFFDAQNYRFMFQDAKRIFTEEELRTLSGQLLNGNKAASEAMYWGYWRYVSAWSEANVVTFTQRGGRPLDSEELFTAGLNALRKVTESFDYRQATLFTYLTRSLCNARISVRRSSSIRQRNELTAGYARGVATKPVELSEGLLEEVNLDSLKSMIHSIFEVIRHKVYTHEYRRVRFIQRNGSNGAAQLANAEVKRQGASYADEYIVCEYLFGGFPEHPKAFEDIGKEGIPIVPQTTEFGTLDVSKTRNKTMSKEAIGLRFKKAIDLLAGYLAAAGIEVPSEKKADILRMQLVLAILENREELAAKLSREPGPQTSAADSINDSYNEASKSILRPAALYERVIAD